MVQRFFPTAYVSYLFLIACNDAPSGASQPRPDAALDAFRPETSVDPAQPDADADTGALLSDTGPDPSASDANDGGACTQPLASSGCPATYPASLSVACTNKYSLLGLSAGSCGAFTALMYGGRPHYSYCIYDGADAGTLIGAVAVTDISEFCNQTSYLMTAGQVPPSCEYNRLDVTTFTPLGTCADSGTPAEPDAGPD
jgi:hypothetical protein